MFCKHCGKQISEGEKFCVSCGNSISVTIEKTQIINKNLKGLGGWLVLVILGLFAVTLFQGYAAYESITLFTDGTVEFLSEPSSEVYIPGYSGLLKFEFIAEILFLVATVYLIYLFFRKNKKFPKYYILLLIISVIYVIIDYALFASISVSGEVQQIIDEALSKQTGEIGRAIISAIIWGTYINKSKRVKATFVEE